MLTLIVLIMYAPSLEKKNTPLARAAPFELLWNETNGSDHIERKYWKSEIPKSFRKFENLSGEITDNSATRFPSELKGNPVSTSML